MPYHRLGAVRFALLQIIVWSIVSLVRPDLAVGFITATIILAAIALLMTHQQLMDNIER